MRTRIMKKNEEEEAIYTVAYFMNNKLIKLTRTRDWNKFCDQVIRDSENGWRQQIVRDNEAGLIIEAR